MKSTIINVSSDIMTIKDGNISISPLSLGEEKYFRIAVAKYVSPAYPGTEINYTDKIVFEHFSGISCGWNSTDHRIIWTVKLIDIPIGFFVLTHKKSGSVKLAPCVFFPEYINKGYGETVVNIISEIYKDTKYEKLFTTIPTVKPNAISLALKSGFNLELILKNHYSREHDEVVLAKRLLNKGVNEEDISINTKNTVFKEDYVCKKNIKFTYQGKEVIFNKKRGGAIKIIKSDNDEVIFEFIKKLKGEYLGNRKLFSTLSEDEDLSKFFENNFVIEGKIFLPVKNQFYLIVSKNI